MRYSKKGSRCFSVWRGRDGWPEQELGVGLSSSKYPMMGRGRMAEVGKPRMFRYENIKLGLL